MKRNKVCVLSRLWATGGHHVAGVASSQTTILGTHGKFWREFCGGGGPTAVDQR